MVKTLCRTSWLVVLGIGWACATTPSTHAASGAPDSSGPTIVHTQGLGSILTGVRGIDKATSRSVAQKLAALRAKYKDAVFVDGGDAIGPMAFLHETQFGLSTYRIFDRVDYAAAALSARDGLHTNSFYLLLPQGAKTTTPLVGTFSHELKSTQQNPFYEVKSRWAAAAAGAAKLQIFGVATTASLTGVVDPLAFVSSPGGAAEQARWVLERIEPGCIPLVLSDLSPKENDELARILKQNALIFEGGYPWRLARPPPNAKRSRTVGPVRIISHFSPGEADVVVLPQDLQCAKATARGETVWKPKPPAWAGRRGGLFSRKPLEAQLVSSPFTDALHLPDIGVTMGRIDVLKMMRMAFDNEKDCRTPPAGDWKPPRWMRESRHLRNNETVYRYDLRFHGQPTGRVYRLEHVLVPSWTVANQLIAVDEKHRIKKTHVLAAPRINLRPVRIEPLLERLKGKRFTEIELDDWPERAGAEFVIDNLVRDIQLLLAWDEEAG